MNTCKSFEECYELITSNGWLDKDEAKLLFDTAKSTTGPLVEVGSYQGRSAMLLGQLGRLLYCIDPWDDNFHSDLSGEEICQRFMKNINSIPEMRVVPLRGRIEEYQPMLGIGFVYLDGDHTYRGTLNQIEWALGCKPQAIALHDVNDSGGGLEVKTAALELLGPWQRRVNRLAVWRLKP